jgi:hypothetical protein
LILVQGERQGCSFSFLHGDIQFSQQHFQCILLWYNLLVGQQEIFITKYKNMQWDLKFHL